MTSEKELRIGQGRGGRGVPGRASSKCKDPGSGTRLSGFEHA